MLGCHYENKNNYEEPVAMEHIQAYLLLFIYFFFLLITDSEPITIKPEATDTDGELDQKFCARISTKNIPKPCKACTRAFARQGTRC